MAAVVVLGSVYSDTVRSTDVTFVLMGFDPDRSQLITALIVGGVAAAAAALVIDRVGYATVLGAVSVGALFTETFVAETRNALAATGALGSFDRTGWILTLVTLLVIGFISAWAGATLATGARPAIIASGVAAKDLAKTRRPGLARRPIAAVLVIALLVVTVPAFGDMVNLSPDALMLGGGNQGAGLVHSVPPLLSLAPPTATPTAPPRWTPRRLRRSRPRRPDTDSQNHGRARLQALAGLEAHRKRTGHRSRPPGPMGRREQVRDRRLHPPGYKSDSEQTYPSSTRHPPVSACG